MSDELDPTTRNDIKQAYNILDNMSPDEANML